jgi:hypothetical protein
MTYTLQLYCDPAVQVHMSCSEMYAYGFSLEYVL